MFCGKIIGCTNVNGTFLNIVYVTFKRSINKTFRCVTFTKFCSISHTSTTFLRCVSKISLKYYQLLRALMSLPKQWTNQKSLEAGQPLHAFVYSSRLAWQLFYLMEAFCTAFEKKRVKCINMFLDAKKRS